MRVTLQLPSPPVSRPRPFRNGERVLLLGLGYVAKSLRPHLLQHGLHVQSTLRADEAPSASDQLPIGSGAFAEALGRADYILVSIPPGRNGADAGIEAVSYLPMSPRWLGYLSATSVYGDRKGGWAHETDAPTPCLDRGRRRAASELAWLSRPVPTHIFRLAGIYGPGRDPFEKLRRGTARVVEKPGHVVNRIHVDDIVFALILSMQRPSPQTIYNVSDGHPAGPGEVLDFAAGLIDAPQAERISIDDDRVSDMARSFYRETKRINHDRLRAHLDWSPLYPDYTSGLRAVLATDTRSLS